MDLSKIIDDAIDKSIEDLVTRKFDTDFKFDDDDQDLANLSKQDKFLIAYSNVLLKNYHEALCEELAKHGIKL